MLADIEDGKIDCVIVKDLSRLGRNAIDTGYYIEQYFAQHKIRFVAVNDNFDTANLNNTSRILLPLKNVINEAYALDIGKKIKASAHRAMADGEFIGARAPFGYKKDPNNCHKLIVDEETAPIVRQIFEWYIGGIGVNVIVIKLNEMGAITPSMHKSGTSEADKQYRKSEHWHSITIHHILKNEVYMGDMVQGKSKTVMHVQQDAAPEDYITVRNTHEPIISREMFEKAQEMLSAAAEKAKQKPTIPFAPNIFKCDLFCPHCGRRLHRQRGRATKSGENYYFICLSKSRVSKDACIGVHINETELKSVVSEAVNTEIEALGNSFSDMLSGDSPKEASDRVKKLKVEKMREYNRVLGLIRGLYENLVNGIIDKEEYAELKSSYENEADELKSAIDVLSSEIDEICKQEEHYNSVCNNAEAFRKERELTAELIEQLIEKIEVNHDHEATVKFRSGREFRKGRS